MRLGIIAVLLLYAAVAPEPGGAQCSALPVNYVSTTMLQMYCIGTVA